MYYSVVANSRRNISRKLCLGRVRPIFLLVDSGFFCGGLGPPFLPQKNQKNPRHTIDGGGAKMAVFIEENGPFWCETGLSFFGVLEREKRLKTQKNRRLAAGLMRFGCKKEVFLRGNYAFAYSNSGVDR